MTNSLGNSTPRNGLVGEWLLDGNALDTSGNGNNGTATNVTYVKTNRGYQAQAGSFGGSSYITASSNGNLNGDFTISGWFNALIQTAPAGDILNFGIDNFSIYLRQHNTSGGYTLLHPTIQWNTSQYTEYNLPSRMNLGWTFFTMTVNRTTNKFQYSQNGVFQNELTIAGIGTFNNSMNIGQGAVNNYRFKGQIQLVRIYNRVLSQDEIQLLYLEGQKLLGPTNIAKYPKLFEGLVGYFENPIGTTELWNIATGVNSTRTAGTNTTDNLGISKALSNPNYTWSSITYTTGYTFENSGGGWSLVTSPTGLSATGINRTTTLRNIFLFSRTLSSDEVSLLQSLCNSDYPYPNPSYDLPNLRDGLVLDLNEKGKDLSGNGNNGTLVNTPTVVRQGKIKGLSYNGSNQSVDIPNISINGGPMTFNCFIKMNTDISSGEQVFFTTRNGSPSYVRFNIYYSFNGGNRQLTFYRVKTNVETDGFSVQKTLGTDIFHIGMTYDGTTLKGYINGISVGQLNCSGNGSNVLTNGTVIGGLLQDNGTKTLYSNVRIFNPKIYNKALSDIGMYHYYYSQKGNFIY